MIVPGALPLHALQENKCKELLAFCGWLVWKGVFTVVEIHMLLKGHTHDDVDALFGV
jgi:hypothetical protein